MRHEASRSPDNRTNERLRVATSHYGSRVIPKPQGCMVSKPEDSGILTHDSQADDCCHEIFRFALMEISDHSSRSWWLFKGPSPEEESRIYMYRILAARELSRSASLSGQRGG